MPRKRNPQTSLFRDSNFVPMEVYKKKYTKKSKDEAKYMNDIMKAAKSLHLPCVHIDYFCGNKFYPHCSCSPSAPAFCSRCKKPILATCLNTINKHLSGHFDILGIGWAIETKHKTTIKKKKAELSPSQSTKKEIYDQYNIPNISINEDDNELALNFLSSLSPLKNSKENFFLIFKSCENLLSQILSELDDKTFFKLKYQIKKQIKLIRKFYEP